MSHPSFDWRQAYTRQYGSLPECMGGPPEARPTFAVALAVHARAAAGTVLLQTVSARLATRVRARGQAIAVPEATPAVWNIERIDTLRRLADDGLSISKIAGRLGMTCGTVAGKCSRLGIRTGRGRERPAGQPGPGKGVTKRQRSRPATPVGGPEIAIGPGLSWSYRPSSVLLRSPPSRARSASDRIQEEALPSNEAPADLTIAEQDEIALMASRGMGITAIAAKVRKPYRIVIAAMERLGVSRGAA